MERPSSCPDPQSLRQLTLGNSPLEEREQFARHLEECAPCADTVEQLLLGDTLVGAIQKRSAAGEPVVEDSAVEQLIRRLERLRPQEGGPGTGTRDAAPDSDAVRAGLEGVLTPPEAPDELGRLGPYRVLRVLGAGGMGIVLQAEDPQLRRTVALKIMKPSLAANDAARQRFLREARAAAAIEHDHIVTIYQVGEDRSIPFIAMQWLAGETLDDRLKRAGRLPIQDVLRIGAEMASGLAAAHERRLVHRDVKPANIWLETGRDRVKILDFGLARAADDDSHLTQMGAIAGTPAFMAPEQAAGGPIDHRCDLFSLGCVLYRMITGVMPFRGDTTMAVLMAVAQYRPPAPTELDPSVPRGLSDLIMQLIAKRPADRPATARVVAEWLEALARGESPPPIRPARRVVSARRWAMVAAAAAVLCAAGWFFAPQIVRIVTDRGELVVESDDPETELLVRQQAVKIIDRVGLRKYDLAIGARDLKSGQYRIEIAEESGLRVDATEFRIERNGRTVLRAWVERPTTRSAVDPSIAAAATEHDAAPLKEWLEGREILTVAQDGTGMYQTIQAALEAVRPGQAVKVLDKGPYRERPEVVLPENVGLVSEVGTRIEWPSWRNLVATPHDAAKFFYGGASFRLQGNGGFRLAGFEFAGPDLPSNAFDVGALVVGAAGQVVIESCRVVRTPAYDLSPRDGAMSEPMYFSRVVQESHAREADVLIRDNEFQGGIIASNLHGRLTVERNLILAKMENAFLIDNIAASAVIRHNVLIGHPALYRFFGTVSDWSNVSDQFSITNNVIDCVGDPFVFWHKEPGNREFPLIPRRATVRNNVIRWSGAIGAQFQSESDRQYAESNWSIGNNCYSAEPASDSHAWGRRGLARKPEDLVQPSQFLSVDPRDGDYLRVEPDGPLAMAGAGAPLPGYVGALPPGAAPDGGDWLTRLLARRLHERPDRIWSLAISAPPPLQQWIQGREQLTVAQDGSARFRTIQEALDALKPGQVVVVLDKGPYRERVVNKNSPADVGLVSLVGTRIEIPKWEPMGTRGISWGLFYPAGFRLSGFDIVCPEFPSETRVAWPIGIEGAGDLVVEHCRILATPRTPMRWSRDDPALDRLVGMLFIKSRLPVDTAARVYIRDSHFDGGLNFQHDFQASISVERCQFVCSRFDAIRLPMRAEQVRIAHNVLLNQGDISIQRLKSRPDVQDPRTEIIITNNLFDLEAHAVRLGAAERDDEPADVRGPTDVRIANNIIRSAQQRGIAVPARDLGDVLSHWKIGPNAYANDPVAAEASIPMLPKQPGDLVGPPSFLSIEPNDRNFLRIAAGSLWATAGAGGELPGYFGPFEPGPAPANDWFSRVRRHAPARVIAAHRGGQANTVALSADGRRALTGGLLDMSLRLWDLETGAELREFKGHTGGVWAAALSPNGRYALSGAGNVFKDGRWQPGGDYEVRLWDVATGETKLRFGGHSQHVHSVAFSPDGRRAVSGSFDSTIRVWDVETGAELLKIPTRGLVVSVQFSPDGGAILSGSDDGSVRLWDAASGEQIHRYDGHTKGVFQVGFSADGHRVFSSAHDKSARIFDRDTETELACVADRVEYPAGAVFSPDGRLLLTASSDGVQRLWNTANGRELETFSEHTTAIIQMAMSNDRSRIVSVDALGRAIVWNVPSGVGAEPVGAARRIAGHTGAIVNFALCRHGTRLLTSSADKTVRLWDVATGKELRRFEGHDGEVWGVAIAPDCRHALTAGHDKSIRLWDLTTEKEIRKFEGVHEIVSSVSFAPDGKRAISSGPDKVIRVWDVETGRETSRLEGHTAWVASAAFSRRGDQVLSASDDHTVRLWDVATGKELRQFVGHTAHVQSVAFAPRGATVLSGGKDHTVRLWDIGTGAEIRRMTGHTGEVWSVSFSPSGRHAISASSDKTVRIWDLANGSEVQRYADHPGVVWRAGMSPDARYAVSGGSDAVARIWRLPDSMEGEPPGTPVARRLGAAIDLRSLNSSCVFAADGKTAVVLSGSTGPGNRDRAATVSTYDVRDGKQVGEPIELKGVVQRALSPDGSRFVVTLGTAETSVQLWDVAARKAIATLLEPGQRLAGVTTFSDDGSRVAIGRPEGWAQVWDAATGQPITDRLAHEQPILSMALSPDGRKLATISGDAARDATSPTAVRLWNASDGTPIGTPLPTENRVTRVDFSRDGGTVLTGVVPRSVFAGFATERTQSPPQLRCWDAQSGKALGEPWRLAAGESLVAVAPDARTVAIAHADQSVRCWDAVRREPVGSRLEVNRPIRLARFSPDSRLLLTAATTAAAAGARETRSSVGRGSTFATEVQVWETATGKLVTTIPAASISRDSTREPDNERSRGSSLLISTVFSPDARLVLTASATEAQIWELP